MRGDFPLGGRGGGGHIGGMLRWLTAGESHGPALTVVLDGVPSGLALTSELVRPYLAARQAGYGRGGRQQIEHDAVEILGGVRHGVTIGSPIAMLIRNRDFANWQEAMAVEPPTAPLDAAAARGVFAPRPGHADLAGGLKYDTHDLRPVVERASARETAARVAVGTVARLLLRTLGVATHGHVVRIGDVEVSRSTSIDWDVVEQSPVRCADATASAAMVAAIDAARAAKDTLGGIFEIVVDGVLPGLGAYTQWDRRLDGRLAQAVCSIPGVKGVEFGEGFAMAMLPGRAAHDPIVSADADAPTAFQRTSNHAGGLEGGVSNGEPIVVRAVMKPLATVMAPLPSVDVRTKQPAVGHLERSDVCVVPAASVVAEAMVAWVLADAVLEKFGGDTMTELQRHVAGYRRQLREY